MKKENELIRMNIKFCLQIVVAICGVLSVVTYYICNYVKIALNIDDLETAAGMLLVGAILVVVYFATRKILTVIIGAILVLFSIVTTIGSIVITFLNISILEACIMALLLFLFFMIIIYVFVSRRKEVERIILKEWILEKDKLCLTNKKSDSFLLSGEKKLKDLLVDIEKYLFSCSQDNNLNDLIVHYDTAKKQAKICETLLLTAEGREIFNILNKKIVNNEQEYIGNSLLRHYKVITDGIGLKQLHLSKKIYNCCVILKNTINDYAFRFDEKNKNLSSIILEKSDLILDFLYKYMHAYETDSRYNIDEMKGQEFERFCANLLIAYGFTNIEVTKGSGDQGVDIIGNYGGYKYAIQCKRYSHKLGNSPIQEVVAGKNYYRCQGALVITNNYFTDGAIELAKANNVELWNRNNLLQLIYYTDNQWDELLDKIKIEFFENIEDKSKNMTVDSGNMDNEKVQGGKWRCVKCGCEVVEDYKECPFCAYVEKSDYKN